MFIGHLPAGYLLARALAGRMLENARAFPAFLCAPLLGSVFPDLDLITITRSHEPWWLNFLLHWSFLLETMLLSAAVIVYVRGRQRDRAVIRDS